LFCRRFTVFGTTRAFFVDFGRFIVMACDEISGSLARKFGGRFVAIGTQSAPAAAEITSKILTPTLNGTHASISMCGPAWVNSNE
jgi:hypothetical protein